MFKRITLFITVNILIIVTISITLQLLGVRPYLTEYGIDYQQLLIFCAVIGFIGAGFSLLSSRWMAKMMMGVEVIEPQYPGSPAAQFLIDTVYSYSRDAGISTMPEVGIYDSPEVNAFATGPSKNQSLVAVSSGLLTQMDREAIKGVIAHEVAHIANGDMVTMTLIQGLINTFVMFFARIAAVAVSGFLRGDDEERAPSFLLHYMLVMVFDIVFSLLGSIVVAYFSRIREFAADRGGAELAGSERMIHALASLKSTLVDGSHQSLATLKINGAERLLKLFSTHPDLDERIAHLRETFSHKRRR